MPKRQAQRIIDNRSANRNPTTISGITLTSPGTAYTAGDGLTLTGVVLAVGAGDGISVAADAVAVDSTVVRTTRTVTAGSGLTGGGALSADLTLNVGAGTLITVGADTVGITAGANYQYIGTGSGTAAAWQNLSGLAGSGLTHSAGVLAVGVSGLGLSVGADAVTLTSSSAPTGASILASDVNGYLQLVRIGLGMAPTKPLSVSGDAGISGNVAAGSATITGAATVGQDFTVGANVLYVNQAGTRVGINRAPDQQFDLDVAGAIRGQYLIGRHAIQLASAVGVWHYDGPAPYNLDFGGSDASHAGVGGTVSGGVIYRPGKFGKAVQVAEATTNLITNPSFEVGLTGWTTNGGIRQTAFGKYGQCHLMAGTYTFTTATIVNGQSYTVSFCHRGAYNINVDYGNGTANAFSDSSADVGADGWGRYTLTFTANGTAFVLYLYNNIYDAVQLEQKAYATPYCDGSLGTGHSWSGTAHASSSSRTTAQIQYDVPIAAAEPFTVMAWMQNIDNTTGTSYQWIFATSSFILAAAVDGSLSFYWKPDNVYQTSADTIAADETFHHVSMTYDGANTVRLFLDGVEADSSPFTMANASTASTYFRLRQTVSGDTYNGNWLIDDLVLLDYAADAKLIRAIYESDAPVFVESSVFHWRSPSASPIWVDEYGLWARSVTGNEILGVYGGDPRRTATYRSWGGVNLEDNDVLIGRSSGGYMHWDDSAQTLNVQGTITALAGSISGVLTIGTSGEIRQGTGTLGTDYTGLRIWRDGDVGRIGGYSANTLQWYAGTDGKLYAGGGSVWLDNNGLNLVAGNGSIDSMNSIEWLSGSQTQLRLSNMHVTSEGKVKSFIESIGTSSNQISELALSSTAYYSGGGSVKWSRIVLVGPTSAEPSIKFTLTGSSYGIDSLESNSTYSRIRTIYGYVDIGPQSASYAHINTDRASFKFNAPTITTTLLVDSDAGGVASTVGLSNVSNTAANSTGVGTVLMKGTTSRNSAGFIKIYIGTTAYYVPVFSAITG